MRIYILLKLLDISCSFKLGFMAVNGAWRRAAGGAEVFLAGPSPRKPFLALLSCKPRSAAAPGKAPPPKPRTAPAAPFRRGEPMGAASSSAAAPRGFRRASDPRKTEAKRPQKSSTLVDIL